MPLVKTPIKIYHHQNFTPEPSPDLKMVWTFEAVINPVLPTKVLELIFAEFNGQEGLIGQADDYYRLGNRSLSVGDVVVIGETAWLCEPTGWSSYEFEIENVMG